MKGIALPTLVVVVLLAAGALSAIALVGCSPGNTPPERDSAPAEAVQPDSASEALRSREPEQEGPMRHLTAEDSLATLDGHPAFGDLGRLALPWYGAREGSTTFAQLDSLLPYHSHIDVVTTLDAVNRLLDDASSGKTVAYRVYSEEERKADPSKEDACLFFFRGDKGAPFAIVSPGGGFSYVGSLHESFPHAQALSARGYNAFSLSYRAGSGQMAAEDLAAAVSFVFEFADELDVETQGYSLWGSSAGARMASAVGSYGVAAFGGEDLPSPAAVIMAYTGQSDHTVADPPTYAVVGDRDGIADAGAMRRRIESLQAAGIEAAIVVFPNLGHGFGLGIGTVAEGWIDDAAAFWDKHRRESAA